MTSSKEQLLPVVHIKLDEKQKAAAQMHQRRLSEPGEKIRIQDGAGELSDQGSATSPDKEAQVMTQQRTVRERMRSPIVRIDLNSQGKSSEGAEEKAEDLGGSQEENIANQPDYPADASLGDINQLLNDLKGNCILAVKTRGACAIFKGQFDLSPIP